jgi:hypothetical protein
MGAERVLARGLEPDAEQWIAVDADATFLLPTWELAEGNAALAFYFRTWNRLFMPWAQSERI